MNTTKRKLPRVAALHDLSCFGRCALTVIIPALSASGIQAVPVPTALLSTHTGGFTNMFFSDLTLCNTVIGKLWSTRMHTFFYNCKHIIYK